MFGFSRSGSAADEDVFDIEFVRAQFPAFTEPRLTGWAFFENAGGSYPCLQVVDRLTEFYRRNKVQPYAPYPASLSAGEQMDESAESLAPWLGVPADWIHFGPSTTLNVYVLARAFRETWAEGDAVVVTGQDHEANSGAWRRLAESGIEVREWPVDKDGRLDPAALSPLLADGRVKLVAFPHCSNIVGEINPAAEVCALAREAGAATVVDGVALAPHGLPDLGEVGADVYLFSTYKTFGPHLGVMVVSPELAMSLGNQGHFFNADLPGKRLTPAGPDHAQVAAVAGVAQYLDAFDLHHFPEADPDPRARRARVTALIRQREAQLSAPLLEYLVDSPVYRLLGPAEAELRAPTIAIAAGMPGEAAAERLAAKGVMAGGGHFYAWRLIKALGLDPESGALRLSFLHYTSPEEIDQAIDALDALAAREV
ncbi:aminotransferase class V-fold PLP-dependent enzyme [uncultured Albimonas sp.]|uniref:aminotransferase class V-fold PLP-dependent enzyme n=1 Tax=uncultured Albimonas sp. TaxID=1331701 RepID=UPI0030EC13B9|tara:strand:+ start:1124 stop:2401 length:1278 start_codon:yes stop_codon:yes gene_type:complete